MIPMNIFMALICVKNYVLHTMRSEKKVIDVNGCKKWCEWQLTSFKAS